MSGPWGADPHGRAPTVFSNPKSDRLLTRRLRNTVATAVDILRDDGTRHAVAERVIELRDPPVAAFLDRQKHIATEHYGNLDPLDLDEYLERDGFQALRQCRQLSPEQIIAQIKRSGLRGRGGAGYPTWQKWTKVRAAGTGNGLTTSETKYVICNGDEGDPGAFMDRMLMESYPYRIIEGVAIAALTTGATEGYFYIRAEYLLAVERITEALDRCIEGGLLGDQLRLHVVRGAGAFVCGEETALLASIEGRRARHRNQQGHQGFRPGRQDPSRGADRSPHGHHHPRNRRRHRRRSENRSITGWKPVPHGY